MQRIAEHEPSVSRRKSRDHVEGGRERHVRVHTARSEHRDADTRHGAERASLPSHRLRRAEQRRRALRHLAARRSHPQRQQELARGIVFGGRQADHQRRRR